MSALVKLVASVVFALALLTGFVAGDVRHASAATTTITCTQLGTANTASFNALQYDHSAGTCTLIAASNSVLLDQFDITFRNNVGGNDEEFVIGTGGGSSTTAHKGCNLGDFSVAAGGNCRNERAGNATETETVSIDGENGATIRMTVSLTIAGAGSYTYNSASVTITTADASTSSDNSSAAQRAVQGSVTRSQSVVIGQNFGSRVANVVSGPATGGTQPGTFPGDTSRTQQFGLGPSEMQDDTQAGTTLRGLAMLASFDTSRVLAAADTADQPADGLGQRMFLSGESPITIWGNGSFTDIENTRNRTGEDNRYDGTVWGYNLGADYRFSPGVVAGLSVGYAQTDITTTFNTGTYDEDTWNLSPYVIYTPSETLTLSAIAGYTFGDVALSRNTSVTGNTDSRSIYLQVDGRQTFEPIAESPFRVVAGLGALVSRNTLDAYTESDGSRVAESSVNTLQIKPNTELSYSTQIGEVDLTPYVKAGYIHDFTDETNGDAGAFDLGGGMRFAAGGTGLSGSVEGTRLVGRDDYQEYTFSGLVAYGISVTGADGAFVGIASPYLGTSLSDNGSPEISAGATLRGFADSFSSKLNFSGDPGTQIAKMLITVDIKF
jgi:hypothetical protein